MHPVTSINEIPPHKLVDDNLEPKFCEAWRIVFEVAKLLRDVHGAGEVRVVGSLLARDRFHEDSDIDLAITNFTMQQTFDIEPELVRSYHPWKIDLIQQFFVYPEKRDYILPGSVPLGC